MKNYGLLFKIGIASLLFVCLSGSSLKDDNDIVFEIEEYARFTLDKNQNICMNGEFAKLKKTRNIGINPNKGTIYINDVFVADRTSHSGISDRVKVVLNKKGVCELICLESSAHQLVMLGSDATIAVFDENDKQKGILYKCSMVPDGVDPNDFFVSMLLEEEVENKFATAFEKLQKALSSNSHYKYEVVRN
ncbi:hypothetical protein [Bacteroides sp.]